MRNALRVAGVISTLLVSSAGASITTRPEEGALDDKLGWGVLSKGFPMPLSQEQKSKMKKEKANIIF